MGFLTTVKNFLPSIPLVDRIFAKKLEQTNAGNAGSSLLKPDVDVRPWRGERLYNYTGSDTVVASALTSLFTEAVTKRKGLLLELDRIKQFYLVQALYNAVIEDALTPDITTGDILQVMSPHPKLNQELEALQDVFSFDQIINDIMEDLLTYGEYTIRNVLQEGRGLVEIVDDVDPSRFVAFYQRGFPYYFLQQTERDIEVFPPYLYTHFALGRQRMRIKLAYEFASYGDGVDEYGQIYPSFARMGRPLLFGVLGKMKELMLLEQLIPSSQLNRVLSGSLLTLQCPPTMPPEEMFEAAKRYEQVINSKIGVDRTTGEITVTDILTTAGRIRVLPQMGEKGQLTNINDVKENRTVDELLNSVQDVRAVICGSLGFPPELFFGGRDTGAKSDFLKRYGRYLRKLKTIQSAICNGIQQMCMAHLAHRGYTDVNETDIQVIFKNELVNIDELEKLEFVDGVISLISSVNRAVVELGQGPLGQVIDWNQYHTFVYNQMALIGKDANFIAPPEGEHSIQMLAGDAPDQQERVDDGNDKDTAGEEDLMYDKRMEER